MAGPRGFESRRGISDISHRSAASFGFLDLPWLMATTLGIRHF